MFQPPDTQPLEEQVEAPTLEDVMFAIFEYARQSDGIDSTEGTARVRQRERMSAKDRELRSMLDAMQTAAYAEGRKDEREAIEQGLMAILGPWYMDPPDGGTVTQFRRMAEDARKWRDQGGTNAWRHGPTT